MTEGCFEPRGLRRALLELWNGLFVYRYPVCCVINYVQLVLQGQEPAVEYYRRHEIEVELYPYVLLPKATNSVWTNGPRVPCTRCDQKNPGSWTPVTSDMFTSQRNELRRDLGWQP